VNWAAAAVVLGMTTSASLADEPTVLSDLQLDAVTAAGVLADVNSFATGFGNRVLPLTDAETFAVTGKSYDLAVGLTLGHAYACCGEEADVDVGSTASGVGDIVRRGTRTLKADDGISAEGLSAGYVVALSFKEPLLRAWAARPTLDGLRSETGNSQAK
jgi:hypothetical protein